MDGPSPAEKNATNNKRQTKRSKDLLKAKNLLSGMEETIHNKGNLTKQQFKSLNKAIVGAFYFTHDLRQTLVQHLRAGGWHICTCCSEADTCIGASCRQDDIVITRDSDAFIYSNIGTIWRPSSRGRYLVYHVSDLLRQLELSRAGLTTLGIVTQNDYGKGVHRMGLKTNFKVVRALEEREPLTHASVQELVRAYLAHTTVSSKHPTEGLFDSAIQIFTLQQYTTLTPPHIQDPIDDLRIITQRLADIRLHLEISREISRSVPGGQEREQTTGFIRYTTVDRPPSQLPPRHSSGRPYKYRKRYAIKTRSRLIQHKKPDIFKQYIWKPPNEKLDSQNEPGTNTSTGTSSTGTQPPKKKQKISPKKPPPPADEMTKAELVKAMQIEHPIRTLNIGTLRANTSRALAKELPAGADLQIKLQKGIMSCLSDTSQLASKTKRLCQHMVGQYLETLSVDHLDDDDKTILGYLSTPFSVQEIAAAKDGTNLASEELDTSMDNDNNSPSVLFFQSLLNAIYNSKPPRPITKTTKAVCLFLDKAKGYLPPKMTGTAADTYKNPSIFLRSTATQLSVEYRRHFKKGALELCKKIRNQKKKGVLPETTPDRIDLNKTPPENFIILNRSSGRSWRMSPMSPRGTKFITLSEDDMVRVFWQNEDLRQQLQEYARPSLPTVTQLSQEDVVGWLKNLDPGFFINKLLTNIGGFTEKERKKMKHWSRSAHRMSIDDMTAHISAIRHQDFNPKIQGSYSSTGYALRGSIRTDGFRLQLLAFKLNELNCVKYRRLDAEKLPDRLTSTLGGTDHYLTEIRNVVKAKEDVERLWKCDSSQIKILGIDLGKAFVIGASTLLPLSASATATVGQEHGDVAEIEIPLPMQFHNLAVSQKAVYQPTFKHRRWLEQRKGRTIEGMESIAHMETNLPSLRGPEASITKYVKQSKVVESDLEAFYNNVTLKKHQWDAERARDQEFKLVAKRLLELVGGTPGEKRKEENKVIIGIGLGTFSSTSRLSSLHTSFSKYFMQLARSLDYIVVGVNEYYTSKRCPVCHEFVGQVDIRQLYCPTPTCGAKIHRDVMAGHNMCNIIQGHLVCQQRLHYLQPYDKDGNYIWEMEENNQSAVKDVEAGVDRMAPEEKTGPGRRKRAVA